jgi:hypothetical protein
LFDLDAALNGEHGVEAQGSVAARLAPRVFDLGPQRIQRSGRSFAAPGLLATDLDGLGDADRPPVAALVGRWRDAGLRPAALEAQLGVVGQEGRRLLPRAFGGSQLSLAQLDGGTGQFGLSQRLSECQCRG